MQESTKWDFLNPEIDELSKEITNKTEIARILRLRHNIKEDVDCIRAQVKRYLNGNKRDEEQYGTSTIVTDKKVEEFNWRDWIDPVKKMQELAHKGSGGQDFANWRIKTDKEICVLVLGDTQLGSWATNYDQFMQITDDILNIDDLYVILVGDLAQTAIKMRGVLEVMDNLIPPKFQMKFLDSWLHEIKHKVICSTWDNHSVMRQENAVGYSDYAEMFKRHTIYFGHIGHIDIQVGDIVYKWAVSHFFTGKSLLNPLHAPMRYMRHEGQDRDIAAQGDFHRAGIMKYQEGMRDRVAMVCGTIQTDSGYGKRFFSLKTTDNFPCVTLNPHTKIVSPYWSVREWLEARKVREQQRRAA
jgi:hypothetical protein